MRPGRVCVLFVGLAVASAWTASALSSSSGRPVDLGRKGFGLHMKLAFPSHWQVLPSDPNGPPASEAITFVHRGTPATDETQWWGPDILLVNGARVHRPADAVSAQPCDLWHPSKFDSLAVRLLSLPLDPSRCQSHCSSQAAEGRRRSRNAAHDPDPADAPDHLAQGGPCVDRRRSLWRSIRPRRGSSFSWT